MPQVPAENQRANYSAQAVDHAAKLLRNGGASTLLLMTGSALTEHGLALAAQIAGKTGCKVMGQTYNPRMARGKGRFAIDRIPYVIEQALPILKDFKNIVLVEANDPVAFFAYPNKPSMLKPRGLRGASHDLRRGKFRRRPGGAGRRAQREPADRQPQKLVELAKPTGALTHASIAQAIAMAIPENAIVVDESVTTGRGFFPPTAAAAPHDWLQNMGGSIGFSTPVATGAAVACPDRKVICMVGDGSAMYTLQSLWTQAREGLNVVTIVFANRIYQIFAASSTVSAPASRGSARWTCSSSTARPRLRRARQGHGRAGPRGRQCRRFRQGAGGSRCRTGTAADRSADVRRQLDRRCAARATFAVEDVSWEAPCRPN